MQDTPRKTLTPLQEALSTLDRRARMPHIETISPENQCSVTLDAERRLEQLNDHMTALGTILSCPMYG